MKQTVIVIGVADVIKLCVVRALGSFGCNVDVVHLGKGIVKPIDYYSKYVRNYYFEVPSNLVQFLENKYSGSDTKPILITLDDGSTAIIDGARNRLSPSFLFAHLDSGESIVRLMNKHYLKELAAQSGMNVADGWQIHYENGNFLIPEGIRYPCFVKGLYSNNNSKKVQTRCDDETQLGIVLESCKEKYPYSVYAEEFINIEKDFGVIGVCDGGKAIVPAKADLLFMGKGSTNGVSMFGKISPFDQDSILCGQIKTLLSKLQYVGIFNIDFVENNGKIYFVEMNFRFAAYGYCLFCAGVNLPASFVKTMEKGCLDVNCQQTTIEKEYYYLNEKIGFTNFLEKSITREEYKTLKGQADCLMVKSKDDPNPYRFFWWKYVLILLHNLIKKK